MTAADLSAAASAVEDASAVLDQAIRHLAAAGPKAIDENQAVAYDLAHAASAVESARSMLDYGAKGDVEGRLAGAFVADAVHDLATKLLGREDLWGVERGTLDGALEFVRAHRDPAAMAALAADPGPRHLDEDF
jgi:(2S)-methylsuccinyl-CoA dehydrogenase